MEKFLFFFVHYGLVTVLALTSLVKKPVSRLGLWTGTVLSVAVFAFLFFWGQWPLVGTYYARYLPIGAAVLVVSVAVIRTRPGLPLWPPKIFGKVFVSLLAVFAVGVAYLAASAVAGRWYPEPSVALEFPLKSGHFYISSGGSSKTINNHMRNFPNAQEFALDIHKLGPLGGASTNILSSANENHHIFGEPVYAPCAGTVTEAVNDVADNKGTSMNVAASDGSGNLVTIQCRDALVSLVHLRSGSVTVEAGDMVKTGQEVGRVGNSGFSEEPHLHIQAAIRNSEGQMVGRPMNFGGRAPSRNDIFSAGE